MNCATGVFAYIAIAAEVLAAAAVLACLLLSQRRADRPQRTVRCACGDDSTPRTRRAPGALRGALRAGDGPPTVLDGLIDEYEPAAVWSTDQTA